MKKYKLFALLGAVALSFGMSACDIRDILPTPTPTPTPTPSKDVTGINLNKTQLVLDIDETATLTATVEPSTAENKNFTWSSESSTIAEVSASGVVTAKSSGSTVITATTEEGSFTAKCYVTVVNEGVTHIEQTYKDYLTHNIYDLDSCPTTGNPKLLIIPVWFNDSKTFIKEAKKEQVRSDIEAAYLGTNQETGWRSVKTFYEEESAGRLTLDGVVAPWYSVNKSYTYYGTDGDGKTNSLVKAATRDFFQKNTDYSRKDFDSDGNGYLDGVLLIYAAPDYIAMSKNSYDNLWAYCYWLQDHNASKNSPQPNVYFWASYDFMYSSGLETTTRVGSKYGSGDTTNCEIDAHTFIHEMGHVFGLDDYYDYGPNSYSPAGGFSMQDCNIGGHDPFSVMAYGWGNPYVVTDDTEITIGAFQNTKEMVVITNNWNSYNSPFDEYIILELYTPTGLNEFDCANRYSGYNKGPNKVGIRMWHVDARLAVCTGTSGDEAVYSNNLTSNTKASTSYGVYQAFSNTYGNEDYGSVFGEDYCDYNLLQVIRNDTSADLHENSQLTASELFGNGTYNLSSYSKQFATKISGSTAQQFNRTTSSLNWSIEVSINSNGHSSTATLNINKI